MKSENQTATSAAISAERDFAAEDDLRTLSRANQITGDRKRLSGVRKHHRRLGKAIAAARALRGRAR